MTNYLKKKPLIDTLNTYCLKSRNKCKQRTANDEKRATVLVQFKQWKV